MMPRAAWITAGLAFAAASVAIHYEVKIVMHQRAGSVQELGNIKVGHPAPDFTLTDLSGKPVTLSSYHGQKAVVLDFWATWCAPCRMALPDLQSLSDKYADRGLEILALDQGEEPDQVRGFIERKQYLLRVLLDQGNAVGDTYGVRGIPTTVLIDKAGVVRSIFVGPFGRATMERDAEQVIKD